jgi:2-iminobutanoate/2-iminopropanoate deaminase
MRKTLSLALVLSAIAAPLVAQGDGKVVVNLPGRNPSPNLSGGVRVGNMFYASGQLGGRDSTIEGQTKGALDATKAILEAAGTTMENAVRCTVFLTRASDFQAMNTVYRTYFPKDPPARSTVVVAALVVPSALVEIECMAVMPKS